MQKILEKEFKNYNELNEDIKEIKQLYNIYEGPGQSWNSEITEYFAVIKITNYIKKLIKEEARFMVSKPPIFSVLDKSGESSEEYQKNLNDILEANLFSAKIIKAVRDCFIGKRIAIKVNIVDAIPIITFVPATNFMFETQSNFQNKLQKVIFFQKTVSAISQVDERHWIQKYEMIKNQCHLTEFICDGTGNPVEILSENKNLGFEEIPTYIIINDGLSHDLIGESDVKELIDNAFMYNRMASEDLDTLRKGMNRIIYTTDVDEDASKEFSLRPGSFWDVETDKTAAGEGKQAQVGTINTDFGHDSRMENALKRIKSDMHELLNIPQISNEDLKGMMTSGKSMKALYWQLITRCEEKFTVWRPALAWLGEFLIKSTSNATDFIIQVENQYPLQENEDEEKVLDMQQVNTQVLSKKSYMKKWHDLKDNAADEELKQIQLEKQLLEDSFGQFEVDTSGQED